MSIDVDESGGKQKVTVSATTLSEKVDSELLIDFSFSNVLVFLISVCYLMIELTEVTDADCLELYNLLNTNIADMPQFLIMTIATDLSATSVCHDKTDTSS